MFILNMQHNVTEAVLSQLLNDSRTIIDAEISER